MKYLVLLAMTATLISCSKETSESAQPAQAPAPAPAPAATDVTAVNGDIKVSEIVLNITDPVRKAEAVALAGERIAYGPGFMFADELFDIALGFDPNNQRAKFYKALLTGPMASKGFSKRVEPLINKLPLMQKGKWAEAMRELRNNQPDIYKFLMDGTPELETESQVQLAAKGVLDGLMTFKRTLESMKDSKLHVTARYLMVSPPKGTTTPCLVNRYDWGWYNVTGCEVSNTQEFDLEYADFKALELGASYMYFGYALPYLTYGADGMVNLVNELSQNKKMSDEKIVQLIQQQSNLGNLIAKDVLANLKDTGFEFVDAVKWAVTNQDKLCPKGQPDPNTRPGTLIPSGVCISAELVRTLPLIEAGLKGQVTVSFNTKYGLGYNTFVDATQFLDGKVSDLKALLPNRFDPQCGISRAMADDSLGGIFPKKDFTELIRVTSDPLFLNKPCQ